MSETSERRPEPPGTADEVGTLVGFLEWQRATLEWKARGVTDEDLRRPLNDHPSGMTLGGLLKHLAYVEDYWFSEVVAGREVEPWASVDWRADGDWDWHSAADDAGEELLALWTAAVDRSRAVLVERQGDLGVTYQRGRETLSLRWIMVHMIEEYARHNGHADLLREQVDGQTGE